MVRHDVGHKEMNEIRRHGLIKIAIGTMGTACAVGAIVLLRRLGFIPGIGGMMALAVLVFPLVLGITELISGKSYVDLAVAWNALPPRKRGKYGCLIAFLAFLAVSALIPIGVALYDWLK